MKACILAENKKTNTTHFLAKIRKIPFSEQLISKTTAYGSLEDTASKKQDQKFLKSLIEYFQGVHATLKADKTWDFFLLAHNVLIKLRSPQHSSHQSNNIY